MKALFSFAIAVVAALGIALTAFDTANADCYGAPCGAVMVPAPNPIPLRRLKVVPAPAPLAAPCGPGCVTAMNAWAGPPPCGQGGCSRGLDLCSEAHLRLLEAAGLHRVLPRIWELLLAPRLLVRFVRTPLLQLAAAA
jgi:hypothetical protein